MTNYQVVTCMAEKPTADYYILKEWRASLDRYGVTPVILGQPPYSWKWGGLASKCKFLKRAIDDKIVTADMIIFTDSFDLVYSSNPREIVDLFVSMKLPIVFGAERACFVAHNNINLAPLHPHTSSSFKYLNSGWCVGYRDALYEALLEMNTDSLRDDYQLPGGGWIHQNDQNVWMRQMLFGRVRIGLDNDCSLILNYQDVKSEDIALEPDGKLRVVETGAYPLIQHFNGGSKTAGLMKPILKHLGL